MASYDDNNSLPQLVELSAKMLEAPDGGDVHATLSIQSEEIDIGDYTVNVGFRAAYLCVDPYYGSKTEPSTKYGMRKVPEIIERKTTTDKTLKTGVSMASAAEAMIEGKMSAVDLNLRSSVKGSKSKTETRDLSLSDKEDRVIRHISVESIGNDRWKITEEDLSTLHGYYLSGERLCQIVQRQQLSNRTGATLRVQVRRKDLEIDITENRAFFGTNNKRKLIGILVAKYLSEQMRDGSEDVITFSSSDVNNEG
ncbi:hypothetical protein [Neorhizobium galegae]|uniref:hypothetical protein n=1 Tax=Neorhizobium galegae TaxID=399 RepID=UPI000621683B|nr:hypothetical protein [Neorhizobium galegae]KAB1120152.1 hypothetical protein F4V90_30510 [Neorhizobium galegae]MCQ1808943.1 hypothetical protein [Neorhizobium galegae]CDZ64358.1 Hypothetical protein NGAL_HAMBI2566_60060 [Neorhizobium galegae bv. orientalis]